MKVTINSFLVFWLFIICSHTVFAGTASSDTGKSRVTITSLDSRLVDGMYRMDVDLQLVLSDEMREALNRGVPLVYLLTVRVLEPRFGWFDHRFKTRVLNKQVFSVEQRYELRYHALSRQYLVTDLNTAEQSSFYTFRSALVYLGTIRDLALLKKTILDKSNQLYAQVKVQLDIESLPVPLKVRAYTKRSWRVNKTRWKNWLP